MEMNFEAPKKKAPQERLPLSEDEAMKEAAELKAAITLDRKYWSDLADRDYLEGANLRSVDDSYRHAYREPSAEEYANAIKTVQELKQLAAEEPDAKKAMLKMARVLYNTARLGAFPIMALDTLMMTFVSNFDSESRRDWAGPITRGALDANKDITDLLTDAEKKLQILEYQARKEVKKDIKDFKTGQRERESAEK